MFLNKELVIYILIGLGLEYEAVFVNYKSRPPLPSFKENYFVHYETIIEQNNVVVVYGKANLASTLNNQL